MKFGQNIALHGIHVTARIRHAAEALGRLGISGGVHVGGASNMLGQSQFEVHPGPCDIHLAPAGSIPGKGQVTFTRARVKFKRTVAERIRGSAENDRKPQLFEYM
jgi:hypothetical protein